MADPWSGAPVAATGYQAPQEQLEAQGVQVARGREGANKPPLWDPLCPLGAFPGAPIS